MKFQQNPEVFLPQKSHAEGKNNPRFIENIVITLHCPEEK